VDGKHKEQQMYWATGLASIASNIVIPLIVYLSLRKSNKTPIEKYNLLVNEIGRQFISGSMGLLSFFAGGALVRAGINFYNKQKSPQNQTNEGDKHLYMLLGAIVTKFVSSALLKPLLSTQLILQFLEKEKTPISLPVAQVQKLLSESRSIEVATDKLSDLSNQIPKPIEVQGKFTQGLLQLMRKHFFDASNQPKIGKFTAIAITAKAAWLSVLALAIYGITKSNPTKNKPLKSNSDNGQSNSLSQPLTPLTPLKTAKPYFCSSASFKPSLSLYRGY
jgi:hypothetical protein